MGKKEERMNTGQVGFKDESFRKVLKDVPKDKDIVKMLEKSRVERKVDFSAEKEQRDNEERARRKKALAAEKEKQKEEDRLHAEEKASREYASLQHHEKTSNANVSKTGGLT